MTFCRGFREALAAGVEKVCQESTLRGIEAVERPGAGPISTLQLPAGHHEWSEFRWLEVDFSRSPPRNQFTIGDSPTSAHEVSFRVTGRGPRTLWIPIGACAQWHRYGAAALTVTQSNTEQVSWRLVR